MRAGLQGRQVEYKPVKVFISWSGERSKSVAEALAPWLKDVIQGIDPWVSSSISAGARWADVLDRELSQAKCGIVCLTSDNLTSPWLLFEAGALSKTFGTSRVIPYRLKLHATDVEPPLSQFQGVDASKEGTLKLVKSLNEAAENIIEKDRLERAFSKFWPDLDQSLSKVPEPRPGAPERRDLDDLVREVLVLVRDLKDMATREPLLALVPALRNLTETQLDAYIERAEEFFETTEGHAWQAGYDAGIARAHRAQKYHK
jgi:hypothetical protein